jgi:hypothetical protein
MFTLYVYRNGVECESKVFDFEPDAVLYAMTRIGISGADIVDSETGEITWEYDRGVITRHRAISPLDYGRYVAMPN